MDGDLVGMRVGWLELSVRARGIGLDQEVRGFVCVSRGVFDLAKI